MPDLELTGRRMAFHRANTAIKVVSEATKMLAVIRGLRKCTFERVRCTCRNGKYRYFCTPDAWAEVEDIGEPTESDSETEDNDSSESGSEYANSLDDPADVQLGVEVELDQESLEELFGEDILEWVTIRAKAYGICNLTKAKAQLVGLTEAKRIQYNGTREFVTEDATGYGANIQEIQMTVMVDRVFYYSGEGTVTKKTPKGAEQIELHPGCFYGSTMNEGRTSSRDALPCWHPLLMYTLKRSVSRSDVSSSAEELAILQEFDGEIECTLSSEEDHVYLDTMVRKCTERPNHVWRSDKPWSRPPSSEITNFLDKSERIFCRSGTFECAKSAVLNGVALIAGRQYASNLAIETARVEVRHLMDLSKWIRNELRIFTLSWRMESNDWDKNKMYTAKWLCTEATGILIVNLIGSGGFNHMICVDLRDPSKKMIHDCLEDHPVRLCKESLECCIGDGVELTHIYARKLSKTADPISGKRERGRNRNARRKAAKEARK